MKKNVISEEERTAILDARTDGLNERIDNAASVPAEVARILKAKPEDVVKLPPAVLERDEVAEGLSSNMLQKIGSNSKLTATQREGMRRAISIAATGPGATPQQKQAWEWLDSPIGRTAF